MEPGVQDIQQRGMTGAPLAAVTAAKRSPTAASIGWRFGQLCVLAALGVGLAIGLIDVAGAETTKTSEFDLAIRDHALARPDNVVPVHLGDVVRLRWTTDTRTTIHLHGYDIESELSREAATTMSFEAHATGRFPVNLHGGHDHGDSSTLLYLEVLPR